MQSQGKRQSIATPVSQEVKKFPVQLPSKAPLHRGAPAAPHGTTTGDGGAPRQPATRGSRPRAMALSPELSKVLPSRSRRGIPPRHDACVRRAAPRTLLEQPRALEPPEGLPAPRYRGGDAEVNGGGAGKEGVGGPAPLPASRAPVSDSTDPNPKPSTCQQAADRPTPRADFALPLRKWGATGRAAGPLPYLVWPV